jgi:hypothetical protein
MFLGQVGQEAEKGLAHLGFLWVDSEFDIAIHGFVLLSEGSVKEAEFLYLSSG